MAKKRRRKHPCKFGVNKNTGACLKNRRARSAGGRRRKGGYRRGRKPFNRGKKCVAYAVNKRGHRTCRSYGGTGKTKHRSRVYGPAAPSYMDLMRSSSYGQRVGLHGFLAGRKPRRRR